jgi:hypothetical protein
MEHHIRHSSFLFREVQREREQKHLPVASKAWGPDSQKPYSSLMIRHCGNGAEK